MPPTSPSSSSTATTTIAPAASARVPFTDTDRQALVAAINANNQRKPPKPMTDVCRDMARQRPSHTFNSWYNFWNKTLRHQLEQGKAYAKEFPRSAAAAAAAQWLKIPSPQQSSATAVATAAARVTGGRKQSQDRDQPEDEDKDDANGHDEKKTPAPAVSAFAHRPETRRHASMEHVGVQTPATSSAAILSVRRSASASAASSSTPSASSSAHGATARTPLTTPFSPPRPSVAQSSFTPPPRGSAPFPPPLSRRVSFGPLPTRSPSSSPPKPHPQASAREAGFGAATQHLAPTAWDPDTSLAPVNECSPAPLTTMRRLNSQENRTDRSSPRKRARHVSSDEDEAEDEDDEMQPPANFKRSKPSSFSTKAAARNVSGVTAYQGPVARKAIRSAGAPAQPAVDHEMYQVDDGDTQPLPYDIPTRPVRHSATPAYSTSTRWPDHDYRQAAVASDEHQRDYEHEHEADADADTVPSQSMRASGIARAPPSAPPATASGRRVPQAAQSAFPAPPTPNASSSSTPTSPHAPPHAAPGPAPTSAPAGTGALPPIDWDTDTASTHLDIQTWLHCLARDACTRPHPVLELLHCVNFNRTRCALIALRRATKDQELEWMWTAQEDNLLLTKPDEAHPGNPKAQAEVWAKKRALAVLKGGEKALWERVSVLTGGKKVSKEGLVVERKGVGGKGKKKAT